MSPRVIRQLADRFDESAQESIVFAKRRPVTTLMLVLPRFCSDEMTLEDPWADAIPASIDVAKCSSRSQR